MKCNSSKFLLISILTFVVGFGIVQVWQYITFSPQGSNCKIVEITERPKNHPRTKKIRKLSCESVINWTNNYASLNHDAKHDYLNMISCMPEPVYPQEAILKRISGSVIVEVIVDGFGNIVSAKVMKGNIVLHKSAVEAAFKTKVIVDGLRGGSIDEKGILVFDFNLSK